MNESQPYSSEELKSLATRQQSDAELVGGGAKYVQHMDDETGTLSEPSLNVTEHQIEIARTEMEQILQNEIWPRVVINGGSKNITPEFKAELEDLGRDLGEKYQIIGGSGGGTPEHVLTGAAETSGISRKPVEVVTAWGAERGYLHKSENVLHDVQGSVEQKRSKLLKGDVLVVYPGTIGTAAEFTGGLDQIGMNAFMGDQVRPVVFVGEHWKKFLEDYPTIISDSAKQFIRFVDSSEDVPMAIEEMIPQKTESGK